MRSLRYLLLALSALMLLAPAALATGPSAGDQQYTDPLGGSNGANSRHSSGSGSTSSTPASSSSSTSTPSAGVSSSTAAAPAASTPTATTAQVTTGNALPRTGFNAWEGAAFGFVLLGAGFAVRRQVHRPLK